MRNNQPKLFFVFLLIPLMCMMLATPANAHRMNIFAWLDNANVIVECNFGKAHPARDAQVTILDSVTNQPLLHGRTDTNGYFSFPVPAVVREGHGLTIDVNAGQGHRSDWKLEAAELYTASALDAGFDQAAIDNARMAANSGAPAPVVQNGRLPSPPVSNMAPVSHDDLRGIIHEAVEQHLGPIRQILARQSSDEPSVSEIIGGLGWIMGIIGIILYFKSRRQEKAQKD